MKAIATAKSTRTGRSSWSTGTEASRLSSGTKTSHYRLQLGHGRAGARAPLVRAFDVGDAPLDGADSPFGTHGDADHRDGQEGEAGETQPARTAMASGMRNAARRVGTIGTSCASLTSARVVDLDELLGEGSAVDGDMFVVQ